MSVDPEDSHTLEDKRRLQDSSSALEAAECSGLSPLTASAQQCVLGKTSGDGDGIKSGQVNGDQRKAPRRSDSGAADSNICDPQGGSQPTGDERQNNDKDVDRGTEKLQALMAEADRIAGGWKRNRLGGGGSEASDGEGVDVERNDSGKMSPASSLFGGGKSFPGEGDDNCSESGAKSDSDNSLSGAGVGRNLAQTQEKMIYVARMPRRGMPYEHWSQKNLRLACRNRGIRSMSKCKDNRIMAKHLIELDKWEKRESPYLGDFRWEKDGQPCMANRSNEITLSPNRGSPRYSSIPEDVKLRVQDVLDMGATFPPDRLIHYGGCSYRSSDVLLAIGREEAHCDRVQCNGGPSPLDQACEGGSTAEESRSTRGEKGTMTRGDAAQPHGIGEGKAIARTASQQTDGVRKGSGFARENPSITAEDPDEEESTIMAENGASRDKLTTQSKAKSGALGAHSKRWERIDQDLAVDPEVVDRLPGGIRIIDVDPSDVEEMDTSAGKQRTILRKIVSKSNGALKASSSRSTLPEKCQENDQETRYLVLAIERPPKILENRKGVEGKGIEGACDAQRHNHGSSHWAEEEQRKRARLEKATEGRAEIDGMHDACSIVKVSKRRSTEDVEPDHPGAGAMAKFDEEIRRADAECSRLKLDRARRDDRNDLFKCYTDNYKELEEAKASGKDPFAVKYLESVVASSKRKLMSLMEVES